MVVANAAKAQAPRGQSVPIADRATCRSFFFQKDLVIITDTTGGLQIVKVAEWSKAPDSRHLPSSTERRVFWSTIVGTGSNPVLDILLHSTLTSGSVSD